MYQPLFSKLVALDNEVLKFLLPFFKSLSTYLLRWNFIGSSSHVNLLICVNTRYDEEDPWASCSTR